MFFLHTQRCSTCVGTGECNLLSHWQGLLQPLSKVIAFVKDTLLRTVLWATSEWLKNWSTLIWFKASIRWKRTDKGRHTDAPCLLQTVSNMYSMWLKTLIRCKQTYKGQRFKTLAFVCLLPPFWLLKKMLCVAVLRLSACLHLIVYEDKMCRNSSLCMSVPYYSLE